MPPGWKAGQGCGQEAGNRRGGNEFLGDAQQLDKTCIGKQNFTFSVDGQYAIRRDIESCPEITPAVLQRFLSLFFSTDKKQKSRCRKIPMAPACDDQSQLFMKETYVRENLSAQHCCHVTVPM